MAYKNLHLLVFTGKVMARNPARVFFISICVSVAIIASIWIYAFLVGFGHEVEQAVIRTNTGSFQVMVPEYAKTADSGAIRVFTKDLDDSLKSISHRFSPELVLDSNTITPEGALTFKLIGVEPSYHKNIVPLEDKLIEGKFLSESDEGQVVIGQELARFFKLKTKDQMVINYQDENGELRSELLTIKGVFHYNSRGFEKKHIYVSQLTWKKLFFRHPSGKTLYNRIPVIMEKSPDWIEMAERFSSQDLTIKNWHQLNPELSVMIEFQLSLINIFFGIIAVTVLMTILTPVQMSWQERLKELKTLAVIGIRERDIWEIGIYEVVYMGILSIGLSVLVLAVILGIQSRTGIDFSAVNQGAYVERAGIIMPRVIYPKLEAWQVGVVSIFVGFVFCVSYGLSIRGVLQKLRSAF